MPSSEVCDPKDNSIQFHRGSIFLKPMWFCFVGTDHMTAEACHVLTVRHVTREAMSQAGPEVLPGVVSPWVTLSENWMFRSQLWR